MPTLLFIEEIFRGAGGGVRCGSCDASSERGGRRRKRECRGERNLRTQAVIEFIDQIEKEEGRGNQIKKYWTRCYLTVRSSSSDPKTSAHVVRPGKCRLGLTSATLF